MGEYTPAMFVFLFVLQTTGYIWMGLWMVGKTAPRAVIGLAALVALLVFMWALIVGVPIWGNKPKGDAYDHAAVAWLATCAVLWFVRWLQGLRVRLQ